MLRNMLLSAITGFAILFSSSSVGAVEIEYWQYTYKTLIHLETVTMFMLNRSDRIG